MEEEAVRWSVKVSKDTDLTLRTYLGAQGMKKGDLSKFIEEAVRRRVFQCTIRRGILGSTGAGLQAAKTAARGQAACHVYRSAILCASVLRAV